MNCLIGLISMPPDRPHGQPDSYIKTSKGTKGKDSGREVFLGLPTLLQEQEEIEATVEQHSYDETLEEEPEGAPGVGSGFSGRIAHQHGKGGMCRDGEEKTADSGF